MNVLKTFGKAPFHIKNVCKDVTGTAASLVVAIVSSFCLAISAHASEPGDTCRTEVDSIECQVLYKIGGSDLDLSFKQNRTSFTDFLEQLQKVQADTTLCLSRMSILGYASPDGSYQRNMQLSRERAEKFAAYLRTQIGIPDSLMHIEGAGIDRKSGLRRVASVAYYHEKPRIRQQPADDDLNKVAENIDVIENAGNAENVGNVEKNANIEIIESGESTDYADMTEVIRYPILAVRSNLLLPLLNVGVELPLGNRLSLGADYYYPWQPRNNNHKNCFQLTFFSGEARYWFGKRSGSLETSKSRRLLGHSIAAYGAWGYYDFEHNWHGRQGDFWSAGLDYVYAMPICKGKLHLEFQIAAGVIQASSQPYDVFNDGGRLIREKGVHKNFGYIGPTKVGVSLVLPINKVSTKPLRSSERGGGR